MRGAAACVAALLFLVGEGISTSEAASNRFTLRHDAGGAWSLVSPDGASTFVVALNHLASPFYFDVITGANGLTPCRSWDEHCKQHNLFHTKYAGNWSAATADFVAQSKSWGFNSAGYEFVPSAATPWPYFPDLFITNASHIFQRSQMNGGVGRASFPDVFTDDFNTSIDARVADWISTDQHINQSRKLDDVVGYYFEDQVCYAALV
jgi:hypothetical protein